MKLFHDDIKNFNLQCNMLVFCADIKNFNVQCNMKLFPADFKKFNVYCNMKPRAPQQGPEAGPLAGVRGAASPWGKMDLSVFKMRFFIALKVDF